MVISLLYVQDDSLMTTQVFHKKMGRDQFFVKKCILIAVILIPLISRRSRVVNEKMGMSCPGEGLTSRFPSNYIWRKGFLKG